MKGYIKLQSNKK